jgi:putative molybdopterin biosynthesis protein
MPEVENHLGTLRRKRGISAAQLARTAGVTRQAIYAMEAGTYVPNTAVALRLAQGLEVHVEDLFALSRAEAARRRTEEVTLLPASQPLRSGQPVQLCRVNKRLVASPPSTVPWYFPVSDAVVSRKLARNSRADVEVFDDEADFRNRVLIAGCDPGISVLAHHLRASGIELVVAHRNSSQSLKLLKDGCVHIAGTHLREESSGESNLPAIGRLFRPDEVAVISLAVWEEGIVTAAGNPLGIKSVEDFARRNVTIVNREKGAGSRVLLDSHLKRFGMDPKNVRGYERIAPGHLPAVWQVQSGQADCCIATRACARMYGLGFIPLVNERYDLAVRRQHLNLPGIQAVLDTLSRSNYRRELESLGGYDTRDAGRRL